MYTNNGILLVEPALSYLVTTTTMGQAPRQVFWGVYVLPFTRDRPIAFFFLSTLRQEAHLYSIILFNCENQRVWKKVSSDRWVTPAYL